MTSSRLLLFVVISGALAVGILQLTLNKVASSQTAMGCQALSQDGEIDPTQTVAFWQNQPLTAPTYLVAEISPQETRILGTTNDEKWIEINLTTQKLIAHEGDSVFLESLISSGLWGRTPPGEYRIWYKIRSTKMEGGSKLNNSYYYLPNVPYTMFFKGDYGIHGTYWHSNFGNPMSHGCVNTPTDMARRLFYWVDPKLPEGKKLVRATVDNPGTRVVIHE